MLTEARRLAPTGDHAPIARLLLPYANEGARLTSRAEGSVPGDDVTFDGRVVLLVEVL